MMSATATDRSLVKPADSAPDPGMRGTVCADMLRGPLADPAEDEDAVDRVDLLVTRVVRLRLHECQRVALRRPVAVLVVEDDVPRRPDGAVPQPEGVCPGR